MTKTSLSLAFLLTLLPATARAQVSLHIDIGLPPAPPLVLVAPGVRVVEGFGEEVFFSGGWYWCRRPDGWYRARTPRERFGWVEGRRVPRQVLRMPPGQYRDWHRDGHEDRGRHLGQERRQERRPERREERREERGHGERDRDEHRPRGN